MSVSLMPTKLSMPQTRPKLVSRHRLFKQMNEGLRHKLTIISAPAGFGKTTLVVDWLTQNNQPNQGTSLKFGWLSLEKADNDPVRFLTYFIAAIQQMSPTIGQEIQTTLASPQLPSVESLMMPLVQDIFHILNQSASNDRTYDPAQKFILVLDDYHLINHQTIHSIITFLIDHMPPQMHLIMTSRRDPSLPLSRWRARAQLLEIRTSDLSFTLEEAAEFLSQVMDINLSKTDIQILEERTEGWIAGLQLAALSLKDEADKTAFVAAFAGDDRYIFDYLVDEVLNQLPENAQKFLIKTSFLDRLSAPLCDSLLQDDLNGFCEKENEPVSSQKILEYLDQANLFIIALDTKRQWYRYHNLFADLLQKRLQETMPDQITQLHKQASDWYEQNGHIEEAIDCSLKARDFERAIQLIRQNNKKLMMRGKGTLVKTWLDTLPLDLVKIDPELYLIYAWIELMMDNFDQAEKYIQELKTVPLDKLQSTQHKNFLAQISFTEGDIALSRGETAKAIDRFERALEELLEDEIPIREVGMLNLAQAYRLHGDFEKASQVMARLNHSKPETDNKFGVFIRIMNQAAHYAFHGELREALLIDQQFLKLLEEDENMNPPLSVVARVHIRLGNLFYERNQLDLAQESINRGFEIGQSILGGHHKLVGDVGLAKIIYAQGDVEQALLLLNQAITQNQSTGRGPEHEKAKAVLARLQLAQGSLAYVEQWATQQELDPEDELSYLREFEYITLARLLLAQERFDTALQLLERLFFKAEEANRLQSLIEIWNLQALTYQLQSNTAKAIECVNQAVLLAEPQGFIRLFIDEGGPMAALLLRLSETYRQKNGQISSTLLTYLGKLFDSFELASSLVVNETNNALVEGLTERELEILQLIVKGFSNRKIAAQLVVSENTIKTHARNIFRKLDVRSRIQAIAKAKELGLL